MGTTRKPKLARPNKVVDPKSNAEEKFVQEMNDHDLAQAAAAAAAVDAKARDFAKTGGFEPLHVAAETLHDRFAMAALSGLFALEVDGDDTEDPTRWAERIAESAYRFANAMMERRKRY